MQRSVTLCALTLAAGLFLMGAAWPELRVRVHDGRLTLQADGVPLYGVLWAISAQTEIQLSIAESAQSGGPVVVESFKDLSINEGIQRLLRKHLRNSSYVIVTDGKGKLTSLRILAGASGQSSSPGISWPAASRAVTDPLGRSNTEGEVPRREAVETEETSDPLAEAVDAARRAVGPEAQIKAMLALGGFQDPRTLEVLQPALHSERADVRKAALEAMRDGTVSDAAALAEVRALATGDPDPVVRRAALDVLVRYDESGEARALLKTLAADKDNPFRSFAQTQLRRMEEEEAQRSGPDLQLQRALGPQAPRSQPR